MGFRSHAGGKASERDPTIATDPSNWLAKSSFRKSPVCFLCTKPSGRHMCMFCSQTYLHSPLLYPFRLHLSHAQHWPSQIWSACSHLCLFRFLFRLNVNDIQDTCQKNGAAALAVGRRDLAKVHAFMCRESGKKNLLLAFRNVHAPDIIQLHIVIL